MSTTEATAVSTVGPSAAWAATGAAAPTRDRPAAATAVEGGWACAWAEQQGAHARCGKAVPLKHAAPAQAAVLSAARTAQGAALRATCKKVAKVGCADADMRRCHAPGTGSSLRASATTRVWRPRMAAVVRRAARARVEPPRPLASFIPILAAICASGGGWRERWGRCKKRGRLFPPLDRQDGALTEQCRQCDLCKEA